MSINQRWGIVRSAKRCRHCILGLLFSASVRLEPQNLTGNPSPPPIQCAPNTEDCVKFWDFTVSSSWHNMYVHLAQNTTTTSLCWSLVLSNIENECRKDLHFRTDLYSMQLPNMKFESVCVCSVPRKQLCMVTNFEELVEANFQIAWQIQNCFGIWITGPGRLVSWCQFWPKISCKCTFRVNAHFPRNVKWGWES
jgi:hypothetical protein